MDCFNFIYRSLYFFILNTFSEAFLFLNFEEEEKEAGQLSSGPSSLSGNVPKVVDLPKIDIDITPTAEVTLPQGQMVLAAKDDTAEYDDADTSSNFKDDPQ